MNKICLSVSILLFSLSGVSQKVFRNNFNTWFIYNGNHKISNKWGLHLEGHLRRNDFFTKPAQIFLIPAINYHWTETTTFTVGYQYVINEPFGTFPARARFTEERMYEQFLFKSMQGRSELISRVRLEQRWIHVPVEINGVFVAGDAIFSNRTRFYQKLSIPFKGRGIKEKSFYLILWDEMMVKFGKNVNINFFDQNRAFAGLGYHVPKFGAIEAGYLNIITPRPEINYFQLDHTLVLSFNASFAFFRKKEAKQ